MIILTLKTDNPQAEIGLFDDDEKLNYVEWPAHRQLAETIHFKLKRLLETQDVSLHMIQGIIIFKGPGSFTGLRIGMSVANALADSLAIPVVSSQGDSWIKQGLKALTAGLDETVAQPAYGALPHTTQPKH